MNEWILLVDDDKEDCDFLKENLIEVGVELNIEIAHDGPAALEILKSCQKNLPKLIVLDINMPFLNGMIVLAKLKVKYNIPVILYSTSCDDELVREAKALGAIDCVKKGTRYSDNIKFSKRILDLVSSSTYSEFKIVMSKSLEK